MATKACHQCAKQIDDPSFTKANDNLYHVSCFKCQDCSKLLETEFSTRGSSIICTDCGLKSALVDTIAENTSQSPSDVTNVSLNCKACAKPLTTTAVAVGDTPYHRDCIKCSICNGSLETGTYVERGGKIAHKSCDDQNDSTRVKCSCCEAEIQGQYVTRANDNQPMHPKCFLCTECGTSLINDRYCELNGKDYCSKCTSEKGYTVQNR